VEPLLEIAGELEQRESVVAGELAEVERLQHEVDEVRARASDAAAFLEALPRERADRVSEEHAAGDALAAAQRTHADARAALERVRRDDDRLAADRAVQEAADEVGATERRLARARTALAQLDEDEAGRRSDVAALEVAVAGVAPRIRGVAAPRAGLDPLLDWSERARGALLLEHAALVAEGETVAREASELLGSVTGEPLTSASAAGLRAQLERALRQG
jgi:chromosome segregation ATPase